MGPLPLSQGYQYLFTVIVRTTRWREAIPLTTINAADCAQALFTGWIAQLGVPSVITLPTPQHHLLNNDCVPHTVQRVNGNVPLLPDGHHARPADWGDHIPWEMLGIWSTFQRDSTLLTS